MKKVALFVILTATFLSCNNSKSDNNQTSQQDTSATNKADAGTNGSTFDISKIPVSEKELGAFPFFSFPQNLETMNDPFKSSYVKLFFPLNGILTPIEGKAWSTNVVMAKNSQENWSLAYFEKSYDDAITAVGGVKIFDGKISNEEAERTKEERSLGEGSIDYWNEPVKVYVIRRPNGDDVYIQLSGSTAAGAIQILQKVGFKQTITMLKSDEIKKQLTENGRAVLHINFDTDKATLKTDGINAVNEIVKVLIADKDLNIAINGYTDNLGVKEHNQKLSENRAVTVKNEIIKAGIASKRMTSKGYGQDNPIADNNTEDGKTKNRRVELLKQ